MPEQKVVDSRSFTISIWNKWYKKFNLHIQRCGLGDDLNQTIEEISIRCQGLGRTEFSQISQREFREFLKSMGYRKRNGYWVLRDFQFSQDSWGMFHKKGLFPKMDFDKESG